MLTEYKQSYPCKKNKEHAMQLSVWMFIAQDTGIITRARGIRCVYCRKGIVYEEPQPDGTQAVSEEVTP